MKLAYSKHWLYKKKYRQDITNEMLEYAITNSDELRDKHWSDAANAIVRIPPSGRILKVVYKREKGKYQIITAFWLD